MTPLLLTIPISHYGERARWALDHAEIDYREEHHLQLFSWPHALLRGGRHTMPVLVLGGRALDDSALVVRWASDRARAPLYPGDTKARREVERFEDDLSTGYGVDGRLVAYDWFFRSFEMCLPYNQGRAPAIEAWVLRSLGPMVQSVGKRRLGLTAEAVTKGIDSVNRTLDAIGERLSDGRRYLFGDTFTAADLTFAALSSPSLLPPQYPVPLPQPDQIPEDAQKRVRAWREHPAGRFADRLYQERPSTRGTYSRPLAARR
jgi:glutathione S-transferase